MTQLTIPTSHYGHQQGSDGVDNTIDIISVDGEDKVAAIHFWEQAERAEADARRLIDALNTLRDVAANLWLERLLREWQAVGLVFDARTLHEIRPDLTDEQLMRVLTRSREALAPSFKSAWDMIQAMANEMYPDPRDAGES